MTTPARVETPVISVILAAYAMSDGDARMLTAQITRQLVTVYLMTIQGQLNLYKCQKIATGPDAAAQRWIEAKARADAQSIARTFNRELENQAYAIFQENRRANRHTFASRLDQWAVKRNKYKLASIGLNTMTAAREYAVQRFRTENNIQGRFRFTGPPPVCKICMRLFALGTVSAAEAQRYGDSQHPHCPHRWEQLIPKPIECSEAWTG